MSERSESKDGRYLAPQIFLIFLIFFLKFSCFFGVRIFMPPKNKSSSKLSSAEAVEGCEDAEFASVGVIRELLQSQERLFKNFVESITASN